MNAFEYLNQAYMLDQRIQSMLQQVSALRSLAQTMHSYVNNEPVVHTKNVCALEDTVIKIMEEEAEINAEIDRLVDLKKEIRETIAEVKELNYRLVLEKRHLCYLSWEKIGADMGHTDRWAQLKHQCALRVVQQILEKRVREDECQ